MKKIVYLQMQAPSVWCLHVIEKVQFFMIMDGSTFLYCIKTCRRAVTQTKHQTL